MKKRLPRSCRLLCGAQVVTVSQGAARAAAAVSGVNALWLIGCIGWNGGANVTRSVQIITAHFAHVNRVRGGGDRVTRPHALNPPNLHVWNMQFPRVWCIPLWLSLAAVNLRRWGCARGHPRRTYNNLLAGMYRADVVSSLTNEDWGGGEKE